MARHKRKTAAAPDSEFEASFFQLAFERLQEKLYNLLPFLVGFEIANKSPDGTKALGVFGFKSNNGQMLFVPAFFINGDVKGVDLMYSKNNEQFYPLNEDFAELFLRDEATGLGDATKETEKEINQNMPPVDLKSLVRPPRTGKVSYASVIDYVEQGGERTKKAFYTLFRDNPDFMESVLRFYPVEKIAKAITPKAAEKTLGMTSVRVVTKHDDLTDLSISQKEEVITKGYVVIDGRKDEEKSKFGLIKYDEKFVNPDESGFYAYLTRTGSLRYALIITKPIPLDSKYPTDDAIIMDLDSSHDGVSYSAKVKDVFTKGKYTIKDLSSVMSKMTDPAEVQPSYDERYILVNEKLKATVPFRVVANFKNDQGLRVIQVEKAYMDFGEDCCSPSSSRKKWSNSYFNDGGYKSEYGKTYSFVLTKKPGDALSYDNNEIHVPKGFKLMHIKAGPAYPHHPYDPNQSEAAREAEKKARDLIREKYNAGKPGGLSCLFGALKSTYTYPLTVNSNGSEYFINIDGAKKKYESALKAKIGAVLDFGLGQKEAEELINSVPSLGSKKGYIKFAYTGDQHFNMWDPTAYSNELGQPTYDGVGHTDIQNPGDGYTGDPTQLGFAEMPEVEGLDGAVDQANQLAQSGQKEIFDTHTIATLAKYVSPESKVSAYMPDFISCLDKLGRMLFLVHWETEKFEEMYGRSELPELVELLTNVFTNLGDLVIFLKRKSPELSINVSEKEMAA
jgi:hypothetical protein